MNELEASLTSSERGSRSAPPPIKPEANSPEFSVSRPSPVQRRPRPFFLPASLQGLEPRVAGRVRVPDAPSPLGESSAGRFRDRPVRGPRPRRSHKHPARPRRPEALTPRRPTPGSGEEAGPGGGVVASPPGSARADARLVYRPQAWSPPRRPARPRPERRAYPEQQREGRSLVRRGGGGGDHPGVGAGGGERVPEDEEEPKIHSFRAPPAWRPPPPPPQPPVPELQPPELPKRCGPGRHRDHSSLAPARAPALSAAAAAAAAASSASPRRRAHPQLPPRRGGAAGETRMSLGRNCSAGQRAGEGRTQMTSLSYPASLAAIASRPRPQAQAEGSIRMPDRNGGAPATHLPSLRATTHTIYYHHPHAGAADTRTRHML
ncbi:PREDICTED: proline-rich protein 2-like [Lipotes vexillifer]|uniref:Proline-rich protein 2-like n=1 Tax=Lipotes vexillifer TaxID=118797 RepID=A0A340Y389_LIPVE|nr:PREDICTED: proline-rich protein 2-like [Lipotes vexillifer]